MAFEIIEIEKKFPQIPTLKKAAAYARVSVDNEEMLHSLYAQVSHYSDMIDHTQGWLNAGVYIDQGISGTLRTRPNFNKLIEDCRNGKVDVIITKTVSRFGRNTALVLETIRELKELGVEVIFEEQNVSTFSTEGEVLITILAALAQAESFNASESQKWRIQKSYEMGEPRSHSKQFGFDVKDKNLVPNAEFAPFVKEIYSRVIAGESYTSIAKDFNARKIMGPYGGKWTAHRINDIVVNEKYLGDSLLQKTFVNNYLEKKKVINTGEKPMYYAKGTHESIISQQEYELASVEVQKRREQFDSIVKKKPETSAFSGVIQCPQCGKNYRKVTSRGKPYYNCSTYVKEGLKGCRGKKIPESILVSIIMEILNLKNWSPEFVKIYIERIVVLEDNVLQFYLRDGSLKEKTWQYASRSESWTPEMKEKARQDMKKAKKGK